MRKLILQEFLSIDGFAADETGSTAFFENAAGAVDADLLEFIGTIDTILLGRNTYEMFARFWPEATTSEQRVADALNLTPKIVFSESLEKAPWGKWADATIIGSDAVQAVRRLKNLPGKNMVLWGSLSLADSLLKAGVVDVIDLRICPVVLGKGKPLFTEALSNYGLKLIDTKVYGDSGIVLMRYEPEK